MSSERSLVSLRSLKTHKNPLLSLWQMRAIRMASKLVEAQTNHDPSFYSEKYSTVDTVYHYETKSLEILFCTSCWFYMRNIKVLGQGGSL